MRAAIWRDLAAAKWLGLVGATICRLRGHNYGKVIQRNWCSEFGSTEERFRFCERCGVQHFLFQKRTSVILHFKPIKFIPISISVRQD